MSSSVVLGVGAGIAAYKSCELLRLLTRVRAPGPGRADSGRAPICRRGHLGRAIRQPVTTDAWTGVSEVPHVRIGQSADPRRRRARHRRPASPGRRRHGRGPPDRPRCSPRAARCLYRAAMHTEMWEHPATQANVALLRRRGAIVLEPATGRLTGGTAGPGGCRNRPRSSPSPPGCWPAAPWALCLPTWPAAAWWYRLAAPGRRSTRSGSSATGPRGRRGTRWPARRRPAAPR